MSKKTITPSVDPFGFMLCILLGVVVVGGYVTSQQNKAATIRTLAHTAARAASMMPSYCPDSVDHALARFLNVAQVMDVDLGMFGTDGNPGFGLAFKGNPQRVAALKAAIETVMAQGKTCIKVIKRDDEFTIVDLTGVPSAEKSGKTFYLFFKEDTPPAQ